MLPPTTYLLPSIIQLNYTLTEPSSSSPTTTIRDKRIQTSKTNNQNMIHVKNVLLQRAKWLKRTAAANGKQIKKRSSAKSKKKEEAKINKPKQNYNKILNLIFVPGIQSVSPPSPHILSQLS
jgi:hypothetical protein